MYNWTDYISPANLESFKARIRDRELPTTSTPITRSCSPSSRAARRAATTSPRRRRNTCPGMVEEGFLAEARLSRIPNVSSTSTRPSRAWWDPNNEYQVPKDYGTTGILYRERALLGCPTSWQEFLDLVKGEASGKTVFVDSMGDVFIPAQAAGLLAQLGRPGGAGRGREILLDVAPHILALDSDTYGVKMASEAALTGPRLDRLRSRAGTTWRPRRRRVHRRRPRARSTGWTPGSCSPTPRIRMPAYAWLDFIHEPEIQAEETNFNRYATRNDAAREFVDPEILNDPAIFPPERRRRQPRRRRGHSGNSSATTSGRSSSGHRRLRRQRRAEAGDGHAPAPARSRQASARRGRARSAC